MLKSNKNTESADFGIENEKFLFNIVGESDDVPSVIYKAFPSLNYEKIQRKKLDPTFIYDTVNLCQECYDNVKIIINAIKVFKKNRRSIKGS